MDRKFHHVKESHENTMDSLRNDVTGNK